MIASSPSISVTSEFAPPPKVGASTVPRSLITHVTLALVGSQRVDLLLEARVVRRKQLRRQVSRSQRGSSRSGSRAKSQATGVMRPLLALARRGSG
jgi:hypothetical protein